MKRNVSEEVRKQRSERMKEIAASRPRCTRIKQDGERCGAFAVSGGVHCYYHGGRKARGAASGRYKTGVSSAVLPKYIAENFQAFLADPKLVELKTQVAIWKAREKQLLSELEKGITGAKVKLLEKTLKVGKKAIADGTLEPIVLLQQIDDLVNEELKEWQKWGEIHTATEMIRKLVESEARRMKDMNAVLTMEQALAFVMSCANIAKRYLPPESTVAFLAEMGKTLKISMPESFRRVETKQIAKQFEDDEAIEAEIISESLNVDESEL